MVVNNYNKYCQQQYLFDKYCQQQYLSLQMTDMCFFLFITKHIFTTEIKEK